MFLFFFYLFDNSFRLISNTTLNKNAWEYHVSQAIYSHESHFHIS